jgi:RNA polymerase sigma factor (sigma-70 family)
MQSDPFANTVVEAMKRNPEKTRKAWRTFYVDGGLLLRNWGFKKGLNECNATALAQKTLEECAKKIPKFKVRHKVAFRAWVFKHAWGNLKSFWKQQNVTVPLDAQSANFPGVDADGEPSKWDCLEEALSQLTDDDQELIRKYYFEPQSHAQIAEELAAREDAIRKRLSRALGRLWSVLKCAMSQLSDCDQEILTLHHQHGINYDRIAQHLGITAGDAHDRVCLALARFRKMLSGSTPADRS